MKITRELQENVLILSPSGSVDASNASEFEYALQVLPEELLKKVILNLSALEYMSSAGIREIIKAKRSYDSLHIDLVFCSLQPFLFEIFDMTGLTERLTIYPDLEAAINSDQ